MKPILFIAALLVICPLGYAQENDYKPVDFPIGYESQIDVIYTRVNGWEGRMDVYFNPLASEPTPVVINIHGGGWNHGEKESQTGYGSFFKNGYAVVNVEYRLVDVAPAPAAIEDVRCALIYIYKNAEALHIDTSRIVVMGGSSGGHLALMAGLLGDDKSFDNNCFYDGEIKVAAIYDKYGPTDLTLLKDWGSAKRWLGKGKDSNKFVESVSPLYHVDANSPPVFIEHGTADPIVPYEQSLLLYEKLKANGVKAELVQIEGGAHGKFSKEQKLEVNTRLWSFLGKLGLTKK